MPRTKKIRFLQYVNKKYNKTFKTFDDYSMWLFYKKNNNVVERYYYDLEEDLIEYTEEQERLYGRKKD